MASRRMGLGTRARPRRVRPRCCVPNRVTALSRNATHCGAAHSGVWFSASRRTKVFRRDAGNCTRDACAPQKPQCCQLNGACNVTRWLGASC